MTQPSPIPALEKTPVLPCLLPRRRINGGGNYCGHDKTAPQLDLLEAPSPKMPKILLELMKRIDRYYEDPSLNIPSLNYASGSRRQRSERREACILTLKFLLKYLDIRTMTVAIPTISDVTYKREFSPIHLATLVKHTGLNLRRVSRAIRDLTLGGLIASGQKRERKPDGSYRGFAALRAVRKELFEAFGLGSWLEKAKQRANIVYLNAVARLKKYGAKTGKNRTQQARDALTFLGQKAKCGVTEPFFKKEKRRVVEPLALFPGDSDPNCPLQRMREKIDRRSREQARRPSLRA